MNRILLACLSFFLFAVRPAQAQHHAMSTDSISRTTLLQQVLPEAGFTDKEVKMVRVEFAPGSVAKPHRHPCPTFGYLLEGELESVFEGKTYHYKKGDTFYEKANGLHSLARNPSSTQAAVLLVFYIPNKDQVTSIPAK